MCYFSDFSPNLFKISLTNTLDLWGVLRLADEIARDANRIMVLIDFDYKTDIF